MGQAPSASGGRARPGCQRLPRPQTVEFSLDGVASLQHRGFTVEPPRGVVERGQTRTISISWAPPADFDVGASGGAWEPRGGQSRGRAPLCTAQGGAAGRAWRAWRGGSAAARHRSGPGAARWLSAPSSLPTPLQPDHPLQVSALLQLRGDVKETYKIIFVAQVLTGP